MSSLNKVILIGHLGKDPELRAFPSGDQLATISIATTEKWKDKDTGEKRESTEWHRVTFFGGLATVVGRYLTKGSLVYVEGSIKSRKFTDKEGIERISFDIKASDMKMLGGRAESGQSGPAAPRQGQGARPAPKPSGGGGSGFDDMDDDIPF
jgi:single-strand DNA-binding protein